jgi:ATP-dependent Clp protease ATP-binding subunit ClpC
LIGAHSGYIGHEHGGYLTNAVKKNPFSVVLFDEIEKASDKVHQLLLQVMDEARLTDGKGHKVSFKDCIVVMTSNIGVKEVADIGKSIGFGDVSKVTDDKRTKAIENALKKKFKPEFLNRITAIINFSELTKENYFEIIKLEIDKLKSNLIISGTDYSNVTLEFDDSIIEFIYEKGVDIKYGARPLVRTIEKEISTHLARKMLNEDIKGKSIVKISLVDGKVNFETIKEEVEEKVARSMKAGKSKDE